MKLKSANVYYGKETYPIEGLPETLVSDEEVIEKIRQCVPCINDRPFNAFTLFPNEYISTKKRIFRCEGVDVVYSE